MLASNTYQIIHDAVVSKSQIVCHYKGHDREICPHVIGLNAKGEEQVLAYQLAGVRAGCPSQASGAVCW